MTALFYGWAFGFRCSPVHLAGVVWNEFDPDPRADNPMTADEIAEAHRG